MAPKKLKLYLDTSVLGYAVNPRNRARRDEARVLLSQIRNGSFIGAFSSVTEEEVKAAPPRIAQRLLRKMMWAGLKRVRIWNRGLAEELAEQYCDQGVIPEEFLDDARHIAIATLWGAHAVVSYNFKHLVRLETIVAVNAINEEAGLDEIVICQPKEVILP